MTSSKGTNASASISSYVTGSVGVVVIDNPPRNALTVEVKVGILRELEKLRDDAGVQVIAITGASDCFASDPMFEGNGERGDIPLSKVTNAVEAIDKPVIAMIAGSAEDSGLSLAVACDWRIAASNSASGLPSTMLGLIPAGGITQRLPRLLGSVAALDMVARASMTAGDAHRAGLFDEVIDGPDIAAYVSARANEWGKRRVSTESVPRADPAEIDKAGANALKRGKGSRSVADTVDLMTAAGDWSFTEGLEREARANLSAAMSPEAKALQHLGWAEAQSAAAPEGEGSKPRPLNNVAVIGGGTMGSAIAVSLAGGGLTVNIVEQTAEAAAGGRQRVEGILASQVKAGRLSPDDAAAWQARITATDRWSVVSNADLVIEAAFEDMDVKRSIFERLDELAKPGAILATNTSYLDVNAIAAFTKRPADVLGLHFFSPAHIMRLLEVVKAKATASDVLATGMALGRRIGKLPVVAGVCDGFIGNRIFSLYRRHAEYLLEDGASPQEIDGAIEAYGFAMGPFAVADMSGLDIAWAMRKRRAATRNPDERYVSIPDRLCEAGRLGKKVGKGWYDYVDGKPRSSADVAGIIEQGRQSAGSSIQTYTPEKIQLRLLSVMANEGARVLEEGISLRPSDIDLVFVNGYGFPRLKGGPMFAADQIGLPAILAEVIDAARVGGAGSEPSKLLIDLASSGHDLRLAEKTIG